MTKILPFVIGALFWAWMTEASTRGKYGIHRQPVGNYIPFIMLVVTLALPAILRTRYNDTVAYIRGFYNSLPFPAVFQQEGYLHLLQNPLFLIYESLIHTFTDNHTIFFFFPAVFVQYSYVRFIRRHSPSFLVGIGLYIFLGSYVFSLAAMKQTIAMAILLYAVDALIDRKIIRFYLIVFVAFLFHTYALVFVILPPFVVRPWSPRTLVLLLGAAFVMMNFNTVLEGFMDLANESGKNVSSDEIIGVAGINPIRVAVYSIPPLFALLFRRYLFIDKNDREHNIIVNMSFITVSIMSIGLINAANMFGRMGQYFEFGVICGLPWMLTKPFDERSERLVSLIAILCFAGYFCYANLIQINFDDNYTRITIAQFLQTIMREIFFG